MSDCSIDEWPVKMASGAEPRYRFVKRRWRTICALIDMLGWLAWLVSWPRHRRLKTDKPRSILVIQLDHLGDAVITLPLLDALKRRYPSATLAVLAAPWNRAVFELSPVVDAIHVLPNNRFCRSGGWAWMLGWRAAARRLRAEEFDWAIDVRGDLPNAVLMWLAGIPRRVGWSAGGGGFLLTDSALFVRRRSEHESRRALWQTIIGRQDARTDFTPRIVPSKKARASADQRLHQAIQRNSCVVMLHLGAGTHAKRWPARQWLEFMQRLNERPDTHLVLIGTDDAISVAARLTASLVSDRVHDWTGQLEIAELVALAARAAVVVGADSGPAHLAAAVGAHTVVLHSGATDHRVWRPAGRHVRQLREEVKCAPCHARECPLAGHPCMHGMTAERVAMVVCEILDGGTVGLRTNHEALTRDTALASGEAE